MTPNKPIAAQARGADLTPESAGAVVYPGDGTVSPFTVINLGSGKVKMGDAVHDGRLPALWFGKDGQGIGAEEVMNRLATNDETLAVVTFSTVESLDTLTEVIQRVRSIAFPNAAAPAAAALPRMVLMAPDEGMPNQQLQELKAAAQQMAADGCNWSMDVGCMFVLAMIERIESLAAAQPAGYVASADLIKLGNCRAELWALPQKPDAVPLFRAPPDAMLQEFLSIIRDGDLAVGDRMQRVASRISFYCKVPTLEEDPVDIIRTLLCVVDRYWALPDEKRELYPSPTSECSPLMIAARRACVERGYTAGGLSIEAADGKAGAA